MAIIRSKRDVNFTVLRNEGLRDVQLSFKARGLMAYMLSLPDNWKFYVKELVKHSEHDGRDSVQSGLKELEAHGYLQRVQKRASKGQFDSVDYLLVDVPTFSPQPDNPLTGNPATGKPETANPQLINTNGTKNLPKGNTDQTNVVGAEQTPPPESEPEGPNPFEIWQREWGWPNGVATQDLSDWVKNYGPDLVAYELEYAARSNVKAKGIDRYMWRIFESFDKKKITTIEQAKKEEQNHYDQSRHEFGGSTRDRSNGFALENRDAGKDDVPW